MLSMHIRCIHIVVKNIVATTQQWDPFCCDNITMSWQLSWSWKWPTWSFLMYFLVTISPKIWIFVLIKSPLQKFNPKISNIPNLGRNFHIFGHIVASVVYSFEEIMRKNSQNWPLKASKISRIKYYFHFHEHIVVTNIVVALNVVVVTMLRQSYV